MPRRLIFMLLTLALTAAAIGTAPKQALASCSGDECGCYGTPEEECRAQCQVDYPQGGWGLTQCFIACGNKARQCAIECCS